MSSGVKVDESVDAMIKEVSDRKAGVAFFRLSKDLLNITFDKVLPPFASGDEALAALKEALPKTEPRYVVVDFCFKNDEGHGRDNLVFISWSPDNATIKDKMLYASSKSALASCGSMGSAKFVQATDFDDLDYKEIRNKCQKN